MNNTLIEKPSFPAASTGRFVRWQGLVGISAASTERSSRLGHPTATVSPADPSDPAVREAAWEAIPRVMTVEQLRQRHSELVDKKFESKLNDAEKAELERINDELDDLDLPIYKPIVDKLQKEFDRLVAEKAKKEKGK
jgi:hypothetical protein